MLSDGLPAVAKVERRGRLFVVACAGIFLFGVVLALLGTLFGLPEIRARLQVNLGQQGDLLLLLFGGIFVATLIVGPLLDRVGSRSVLAVSSLLVTTALLGFSAARSFSVAAIWSVTLGLGGGGLNTSTNVLVSDLYVHHRGSMLNILGTFFGIGALFIPLLAASILAWLTVIQLIVFVACLAAVCVLAYALLRFPPAREAQTFSLREAAQTIRYPGVLTFGLLLFFQSGNEASMGGWISTYLGGLGSKPRTATWMLAGYWIALMLGRMFAARLLRRVEKGPLVLISGLGSIAACALLLMARSISLMAASVALTGISFAGIFPTTLAMAGDRYQRFAGTVFSILFSIALVGGMVFPWAMGHLFQSFGMRSGMVLPLVSAMMICTLVAVIMARDSRAPESESQKL